MKIIRLQTTERTADFSNNLSDNLTIKPFSKVGLLNLSLILDDKNIIISATNNEIKFKTKQSGNEHTVSLTVGDYNIDEFVDLLLEELNAACNIIDDLGFQWLPIVDNGILKLQYKKTQTQSFSGDVQNNVNYVVAATTYNKNAGVNTTWNSYVYENNIFIQSAGYFTCQLAAYASGAIFSFGLIEDPPGANSVLEPDNSFIAVVVENDLYEVWYNGAKVAGITATVPALNDVVGIWVYSGKYYVGVGKNANNTQINTLWEVAKTNYKNDHHCYISFKNTDDTTKLSPRCYNDPFLVETLNGITRLEILPQENNFADYTTDIGNLGVTPYILTITLNAALASMLGFLKTGFKRKATSGSFNAKKKLQDTNIPSSLLVELPGLGLHTYDFKRLQQKRRDIVAIIPALERDVLNMTYQTNHPIMVDLNNSDSRILSTLACRVLAINDLPIKINSYLNVTLLVDSP